jgi:hypothetical protein
VRIPRYTSRQARKIDPAIRTVVASINRLSFVDTTLFSCAGYGPAGDDVRHPNETIDSPWGHNRIAEGYIMIAYAAGSDWRPFHRQLSSLSTRVKSNRLWRQLLQEPVFAYFIYNGTAKHVAKRWTRVDALVNRWLAQSAR